MNVDVMNGDIFATRDVVGFHAHMVATMDSIQETRTLHVISIKITTPPHVSLDFYTKPSTLKFVSWNNTIS